MKERTLNNTTQAMPAGIFCKRKDSVKHNHAPIVGENDPLEHEADTKADMVMQMSQPNFVQRKTSSVNSNEGTFDNGTRSFMENRFGEEFSNVKIHTDNQSIQASRNLNAKAFTVGNDIYFNEGEYQPHSHEGKHLLAHELAHTVQHKNNTTPFISRKVYKGEDHNGKYSLDDQTCTLLYEQDWFFRFDSKFPAARHLPYMQAAETQVENVWSHKHKIKPDGKNCACKANGIDVSVDLHTSEGNRGKKKGYGVKVTPTEERGQTWPDEKMILGQAHESAVQTDPINTQQRIAHEFGHTLGLIDEYDSWADFWGVPGHNDITSIMHSGDMVRPRHYQHFADIVNAELSCNYKPEGIPSSSLATPTAQVGVTGALRLDNAQFVLGLHADRRIGNNALFGLYNTRLGVDAYINTSTGSVLAGPTIGASLNRWYHPLYLDISTGILFDPGNAGRKPSLDIPASFTLGFRGNGFNAGLNYTGMIDALGNTGYTHLIGVNLQFDL
jgi:hypothetical protein